MSEVLIQETTLTEIGDAIRETHKIEGAISPLQMPSKIRESILGYLDTSIIIDWCAWFQHGRNVNTADYINTSNGMVFDNMFDGFVFPGVNEYSDEDLMNILSRLDLRKGVSFNHFLANNKGAFSGANTKTLMTINGYTFNSCFEQCNEMRFAPEIMTDRGEFFSRMFYGCELLIGIGLTNTIDVSNVKPENSDNALYYMFADCRSLQRLTLKTNNLNSDALQRTFYNMTSLKNLSINGKIIVNSNSNVGLNVAYSSNLTVESLINLLESLENPEKETTSYTVAIGTTNYRKLEAYIRPETITDENPNGLKYTDDEDHILNIVAAKNIVVS